MLSYDSFLFKFFFYFYLFFVHFHFSLVNYLLSYFLVHLSLTLPLLTLLFIVHFLSIFLLRFLFWPSSLAQSCSATSGDHRQSQQVRSHALEADFLLLQQLTPVLLHRYSGLSPPASPSHQQRASMASMQVPLQGSLYALFDIPPLFISLLSSVSWPKAF